MINVIRAELAKLRRPSLSLSTVVAVTFVTGLVTSLLFLLVDSPEGNGERGTRISREVLELSTGISISFSNSAGLLGIVALCIFAAQTAQEYTYGTLRNLLVRQPSRMKILIGKLISMKMFAVVMVTISAILALLLSYIFAGVMDISTTAWSTNEARDLIIEGLLTVFVTDLGRYFPGQLLTVVADGGTDEISYQYALFTSYGFLTIGLLLVAFLFKKRDVAN